jgi:hypothetical protein
MIVITNHNSRYNNSTSLGNSSTTASVWSLRVMMPMYARGILADRKALVLYALQAPNYCVCSDNNNKQTKRGLKECLLYVYM